MERFTDWLEAAIGLLVMLTFAGLLLTILGVLAIVWWELVHYA